MRFRRENISSFRSNVNRDRRRRHSQECDSYAFVKSRPQKVVRSKWTDALEQAEGFLHTSKRYSLLQYPLTESWSNHCLPLVIKKVSCDMCMSIFCTIPRVITKAEEGSALLQACNAVGYAYVAHMAWSPRAISDQSRAYGTALAAVNSALRDPRRCKSDDTLLGVWLLGLYEVTHQI